jgi:hypothetical protein
MAEDERALDGDDLDDRVIAREWHELEEDALTDGEASIRIVASAAEMLREKSFGDLTEEERLRVSHLIRKLTLQLPVRRTRRLPGRPVRPAVRRPPNAAPLAPHAGRALRARVARPWTPDPSARADPRHLGLDGAVLARADAVRVRRDGGRPARRGLLLRDPADPRHADAPHEGSRPSPSGDRPPRGGLGGRDPDRGVAQGARGRLEPARVDPRRGRRDLFRRARTRGARPAARPDGQAPAARPQGSSG